MFGCLVVFIQTLLHSFKKQLKKKLLFFIQGELFRYKNWGPGQPDNNGGNEHCVEWDNYNRNWNDKDCYRHQGLICEDRCELNPAPTDKDCL